uniref:Phospholipid scramblase n=1 Tax=Plectus sambesii TaxID=2011161 RepID=A0A914WPY4_9BILA
MMTNQVGQQPMYMPQQMPMGQQTMQQQMIPSVQYSQMAPPPCNPMMQSYNPAVTVQPGVQQNAQNIWAQHRGQVPAGCPPGLEYLTMVDQILCHQFPIWVELAVRLMKESTTSSRIYIFTSRFWKIQKAFAAKRRLFITFEIVELLEAFTGWETNNKYVVKNSMGQQIFYAFEETDMCMRMCFNNNREFTLHIVDNMNQEVMRIYRPLKFCGGCCWFAGMCEFCSHELYVEAPPGTVVGSVKQTGDICTLNYEISDADGNVQLLINGPCIACECCADIEFPVLTKDGAARIGCVTKQWSGFAQEMYTNADNFGITFPLDLDVKTKATLLGATFLIDFMAFEKPKNQNNNNNRW